MPGLMLFVQLQQKHGWDFRMQNFGEAVGFMSFDIFGSCLEGRSSNPALQMGVEV